jgi:ribokinase
MASLTDKKGGSRAKRIKKRGLTRRYKKSSSRMGNYDVLCVGRPAQDTLLTGEIFKPVCKHGVCYEHIPLGAKSNVQDISVLYGGNALNAAITFSRQALSTAILAQIGTDSPSDNILQIIKNESISTELVYIDPSVKVAQSTNIISPDGERAILTYPGSLINTQSLLSQLEQIETRWIYISSAGSMDLLEGVIKYAELNEVKVAFNPGGVELLKVDQTKQVFGSIDTLIMNKEEASKFFGDLEPASLCSAAGEYVNTAIVTDGPNGSFACSDGKDYHQPISKDVVVVDRTGAGDAFASGVVAALAWGKSLKEALQFGSENSTSVVQFIGAHQGIIKK